MDRNELPELLEVRSTPVLGEVRLSLRMQALQASDEANSRSVAEMDDAFMRRCPIVGILS